MYLTEYDTGLIGKLTLGADEKGLTGSWFNNDRYYLTGINEPLERADDLPVFHQAFEWLDRYFAGKKPAPAELPLAPRGTAFQQHVWHALANIPYGKVVTYGDVAAEVSLAQGKRTSARAVGGAVGRNPLCVIVPCHRVVGASGSLTGFGGGIPSKVALLEHEGVDASQFKIPTKGTALVGKPNIAYMGKGSQFQFDDLSDNEKYDVMLAHDASFDGVFVNAVKSTRIYCRPGCKVRVPKRENCTFYRTSQEAEAAGYRPCKLCKPNLK